MPLVLLFGLHLPRITRLHPSNQGCCQRSCQATPYPSHRSQYPIDWIFDIFDIRTPDDIKCPKCMAGAMAFVPLPAGIVLQASRRPECRLDREKGNTNGKIRLENKCCGQAEAGRQ